VPQRSLLVAARLVRDGFGFQQRARLGPLQPELDPREVVKEQLTSAESGQGAQVLGDASEDFAHRGGGTQREDDTADAHAHEGGDLQQLEPEGACLVG